MDIADCRDISSLQAIIFMILFLQSSAKLATCYAYLGCALRAALRMGMHRNFDHFNPIEAECRKRSFWVIRKMDIYVGALLGLPHTISEEDIDQSFPAEVDDEYITAEGIKPMPEGSVTVIAASNAHTRIVQILDKVVRLVYPIKPTNVAQDRKGTDAVPVYRISYNKIQEIERELHKWSESLPLGLRPGGEAPRIIVR